MPTLLKTNNMMKKILFTTFMLLALACNLLACDICNFFDYANRQNNSFVSVFYRYRLFNNYAGNTGTFFVDENNYKNARIAHSGHDEDVIFEKTAFDYTKFESYELRFNYSLNQRYNFQVILPYERNEIYHKTVYNNADNKPGTDSTMLVQGFGDAIFLAEYVKTFGDITLKHFIKPGIAVKMPTGQFQQKSSSDNEAFPYDYQTGTGSIDFIARLNYMLTTDQWGIQFNTNYKWNTQGKHGYTFGNSLNTTLMGFYKFNVNMLNIFPRAGGYLEYAAQDRKDGQITKITEESGGHAVFANMGADFVFKDFIVRGIYQKPVYNDLNGRVMQNAGRLNLGVIYNF